MSISLTHFSLFTGIGGIDLAAEWAGFRTIGQVEKDDYATTILEKHWPDVPRWRDIKNVTARSFRKNTKEYCPFLLTGGFPCQPFSYAGKRCGQEDDRWLWPEMLRVVRELRPPWVVGENVPGLIDMGLDDVLSDLEREKYEVRAFLIPALAVGTPHQRERIFVIAHTGYGTGGTESGSEPDLSKEPSSGCEGWLFSNTDEHGLPRSWIPIRQGRSLEASTDINRDSENIPHPNITGSQGYRELRERGGEWLIWAGGAPLEGIWESEPSVGRVAHGVPSRVDRLRCLGNAVVPQQIYPILKGIAEIESIDKVS